MKVVFVPNYFYLNIPIFEPIITQLSEKGITSYVLRLPGNTDIPADRDFDLNYFKSRGINFIEIPIFRLPYYKNRIFSKFKLLNIAFRNWKIVRTSLKEVNPDTVVVGSDLGSLNIRFLMDACYSSRIPVVILYSCDLPKLNARAAFRFFYSWRNRYILKLRIISFFRASLFTGTIPGEYALDSTICVASEEICKKLVAKGISRKRIIVTGMPFPTFPISSSSEGTFKKLGIPQDYKLIVLFTECIQDIYGIKYAKDLFIKLAQMVKNLPNDIFFLIKLHPLESKEMEIFIKNTFNNKPRCKIITNFNVEELIGVTSLCIAHFSRVLITAALIHKRFLSINLMKDRKRTFISGEEAEILEVNSSEDLERKIEEVLENSEFKQRMDRMITGISNRFYLPKSSEKIVEVILAHINEFRRIK